MRLSKLSSLTLFATTAFSIPFTPTPPQKNTNQVMQQPQRQSQSQRQAELQQQSVSNDVPTELAITGGIGAVISGATLTHRYTKDKYYKKGKKEGKQEGVNLYDEWLSKLAACFNRKSIEGSKTSYEELLMGLEECSRLHPRPSELGEPPEKAASTTTDNDNEKGHNNKKLSRSKSRFGSSKMKKTDSKKSTRFHFHQLPDFLARTVTRTMTGYNRALSSLTSRPNLIGGEGVPATNLLRNWKFTALP